MITFFNNTSLRHKEFQLLPDKTQATPRRGGADMVAQRKGRGGSRAMTRREALRLGAAAAAGAAAGPFGASPAQAEADWQRYKGTTLFLLFYKHPWADQTTKYFPEFESLTGMKLQSDVIPEVQGREKLAGAPTSASAGTEARQSRMHAERPRARK